MLLTHERESVICCYWCSLVVSSPCKAEICYENTGMYGDVGRGMQLRDPALSYRLGGEEHAPSYSRIDCEP